MIVVGLAGLHVYDHQFFHHIRVSQRKLHGYFATHAMADHCCLKHPFFFHENAQIFRHFGVSMRG